MSSSLDFVLKLTDRVTAPLKHVQSQIKAFNQSAVNSFKQIGVGSLAIWGTAKSIMSLVEPAEEMDRALKKAGLSGITSLDELRTEAKKFSSAYGTSALDFVNSASLVKNTLTSISAKDLPKATAAINLLSKATGDSMETSSAYIAQMLSNYKNVANKMGQLNFTKQALGVAASGVYENFYKNLSKAGQELGMSFTDANGKMLAMPDILSKIQGKFGKDLAGNLKAQKALDAAFGDGAKLVNVLSNNSGELNKHIKAIGGNGGFDLMKKMAEANVKPLDRINAQFMNIKESLGRAMLPAITPVMNYIGGLIDKFGKWMDMFPNIAKWIGIITLAVMGLAAAAAVFAVISGIVSLMMSPFMLIVLAIGAVIAICWVFRKQIGTVINWVITKVMDLWNAIKDTWVIKALIGHFELMGKVFGFVVERIQIGFKNIVSAFSTAIEWAGDFWDSIKDTRIIQGLISAFEILFGSVSTGMDNMAKAFSNTIDWISAKLDKFEQFFTNLSFDKIGDALSESLSIAWKNFKNKGIEVINAIIEKLNYIPGVNIELVEYEPIEPTIKASTDPSNSPLTGTTVNSVEPGGLSKEIKNSKSQTVDNSQNINSVTFNVKEPMTPAKLQEWNYMYGG